MSAGRIHGGAARTRPLQLGLKPIIISWSKRDTPHKYSWLL